MVRKIMERRKEHPQEYLLASDALGSLSLTTHTDTHMHTVKQSGDD